MNGDNQHVDGDDYTWDGGTSNGAPVFNSDAVGDETLAELREKFGAYFDAIEDVDAWCAAVRRGDDPPAPDLRTLAEREHDDVAALRADLDRLAELVRLTTGPVDVALQVDAQRDQIAELGLRCDNLVDALAALAGRVKALETALSVVDVVMAALVEVRGR